MHKIIEQNHTELKKLMRSMSFNLYDKPDSTGIVLEFIAV